MPLIVRDVSVRFGGLIALKGVRLTLHPGEILGLIGPNGAGKTTLFNVISGHVRPTEGEVLLDNATITALPPHRRTRLGVGRTFQIPRPFPGMTVYENLLVEARYSRRTADFEKAAARALEVTELAPLANHPVEALNVPQLKRLELARALATTPRYLLLDEVFAGLTPAEKAHMRDLVQHVAQEGNLGVLLVEHDLKTVFHLSRRVIVLHFGEVLAEGSPREVAENPKVVRAYTGGQA